MTGYSTTTGNRLQSDGVYSYTYDYEGNLSTRTKISNGELTEYTWDYRQRLTKVLVKNSGGTVIKEQRNAYDAFNRRIGIWEDADGAGSGAAVQTWVVYDGMNPYIDFSGSTLTTRRLSGLAVDEFFARYDGTNADWYLTDRLGTVRQISRTNSTVLDTITYDSYGNILSESSPSNGDRFKFTSREWDVLAGHYDYRTRPMLPGPGRFGGEDRIGFSGGDANLHRYVSNAPTNAVDPDGQQVAKKDGEKKSFYPGMGYGGEIPPSPPKQAPPKQAPPKPKLVRPKRDRELAADPNDEADAAANERIYLGMLTLIPVARGGRAVAGAIRGLFGPAKKSAPALRIFRPNPTGIEPPVPSPPPPGFPRPGPGFPGQPIP